MSNVLNIQHIQHINNNSNKYEIKKDVYLDIKHNNKPYIHNNQEHLANIYKIYNPGSNLRYEKNKYNNDKINYLKKIEKYSDYHNVYKPKKYINDNNINRNRKLSPIIRKPY